jgi:hypothetical protein
MHGPSDTEGTFMLLFLKIRKKVAQYLVNGYNNIP